MIKVLQKRSNLTTPEIAELSDKTIQSVTRIVRNLIKDVTENIYSRELTSEEKEERYGKKVNCKVCVYWLEK